MKNILINGISAGSGGAITYLKNLMPRLLSKFKQSDDVKVYLLIKDEQLQMISHDVVNLNAKIIIAPSLTGYSRFLWEQRNLKGLIEDYSIDLVFTPYQIAKIFKGKRNIVMLRNMDPFTFQLYPSIFKNWLRNHLLKYKTKQTLKSADVVVAVSQYVADFIINNSMASDTSIEQIYHGRNPAFSPNINENDSHLLKEAGIEGRYIFTCGSLFPYRKCEDVLIAFSRLQDAGLKLVVAGSGNDMRYQGKLTKLINDHGLVDRVLMLGHVSQETMMALYRNSLAFVAATETEACPNIAIEGMSSGCQIVSSDAMPLPEFFQNSATYYEAGNVAQLTEAIETVLKENGAVNDVAVNLIASFSWDRCAEETYNLIIKEAMRA